MLQQYSILDRVTADPNADDCKPKKPLKDIQLIDLLPVQEVQESFKQNCATLVSRIITKHLSVFNHMQDVVIRHIPHLYSDKMAEKSEIVSRKKESIKRIIIFCINKKYPDKRPEGCSTTRGQLFGHCCKIQLTYNQPLLMVSVI